MQRSLLLAATLLFAGAPALLCQQATNDANPLYRSTTIRLGTITVPPIDGVPFSATALVENRRVMPDGSVAVTLNVNLIGRDSRGRTHGEMRQGVPEGSQATPKLTEVHIFDPQTRRRTVYYTATHIATIQPGEAPRGANPAAVNSPLVKVEDLGSSTMENIDVKGTRRSVTTPAGASNLGVSFTVVDEYWYSEDLHVNLKLVHNDPRTGEQTVTLTDIKREEPPASFFGVPADYKIVDMTPPAAARSGSTP